MGVLVEVVFEVVDVDLPFDMRTMIPAVVGVASVVGGDGIVVVVLMGDVLVVVDVVDAGRRRGRGGGCVVVVVVGAVVVVVGGAVVVVVGGAVVVVVGGVVFFPGLVFLEGFLVNLRDLRLHVGQLCREARDIGLSLRQRRFVLAGELLVGVEGELLHEGVGQLGGRLLGRLLRQDVDGAGRQALLGLEADVLSQGPAGAFLQMQHLGRVDVDLLLFCEELELVQRRGGCTGGPLGGRDTGKRCGLVRGLRGP